MWKPTWWKYFVCFNSWVCELVNFIYLFRLYSRFCFHRLSHNDKLLKKYLFQLKCETIRERFAAFLFGKKWGASVRSLLRTTDGFLLLHSKKKKNNKTIQSYPTDNHGDKAALRDQLCLKNKQFKEKVNTDGRKNVIRNCRTDIINGKPQAVFAKPESWFTLKVFIFLNSFLSGLFY